MAFINCDCLINIGTYKHLLVIQYPFFCRYWNSITARAAQSSAQAVRQCIWGGHFAFSWIGPAAKTALTFPSKHLTKPPWRIALQWSKLPLQFQSVYIHSVVMITCRWGEMKRAIWSARTWIDGRDVVLYQESQQQLESKILNGAGFNPVKCSLNKKGEDRDWISKNAQPPQLGQYF